MQSEKVFPNSHQLKSYVASKSRLKLAARAVLSADAGLLVIFLVYKCALYFIMAALWNRAVHYIFAMWFLSIFLVFFLT